VMTFTLKMEAERSSETLLSNHIITWRHNPEHLGFNSNILLLMSRRRTFPVWIKKSDWYSVSRTYLDHVEPYEITSLYGVTTQKNLIESSSPWKPHISQREGLWLRNTIRKHSSCCSRS
jgi:hypothetical protein